MQGEIFRRFLGVLSFGFCLFQFCCHLLAAPRRVEGGGAGGAASLALFAFVAGQLRYLLAHACGCFCLHIEKLLHIAACYKVVRPCTVHVPACGFFGKIMAKICCPVNGSLSVLIRQFRNSKQDDKSCPTPTVAIDEQGLWQLIDSLQRQ